MIDLVTPVVEWPAVVAVVVGLSSVSRAQVNDKLMDLTRKDSIFMNCLPAAREKEQTGDHNSIRAPSTQPYPESCTHLYS